MTILELIFEAHKQLQHSHKLGSVPIARDRLNQATVLLLKGYPLEADADQLLFQHGQLSNVPEKQTA